MKKYKVGIIGATGMVGQRFATLLAGCSKKTECDICEEVKKCNSKKIMGEEFIISKWMTIVAWLVFLLLTGLNIQLVIQIVGKLL